MVSTLLRTLAVVCCLIIGLSLLFFVIDQTKGGEKTAEQEIQGVLHPVAPPPKPHGQPRKTIDEVAHDLTTPFNGIVHSNDKWARHLVPDVLGIIVLGFGLGFLARVISARE